MPRVTKERTKYHAPKAAPATKPVTDAGNIVSAPVPLTDKASEKKDVAQPLKSKRAKRADRHQ
ncbi:hypothetical protein GGI18_005085, partial [Coemansia linderi]